MMKKDTVTLIRTGLAFIFISVLLRLLLTPLPDVFAYIIKLTLLSLVSYYGIQLWLGLTIPFQTTASWKQQLKVAWLCLLTICFYAMTALVGISQAPQLLPKALIIALGAGFFEEYFFRGVLLQVGLRHGIQSTKQVWVTVIISSLTFGLAHVSNLTHQPLNATLYQMYYATALGIYFAAITLRTGGLWWTIILHALMDLGSILMAQSTSAKLPNTGEPGLLILLAMWLPIILLGLFLLRPSQLSTLQVTQKHPHSHQA